MSIKFTKLLIYFFLTLSFISCNKTPPIHPRMGAITESVYAIGNVKSDEDYHLKLSVVSSIKEFYVKEGEFVKKGDRLVTTDTGVTFRTPISGIVTSIPVSLGETIAAQTAILSVINLKNLYLEASLEQSGALKIVKGQKVVITFESFRQNQYLGKVKNLIPRDNEFIVQVEVDKLPENIMPGMNADLSIEINTKPKAVLIPVGAVSNGMITLIKNGKKEKVKVSLGSSDAEWAEVLEPKLEETDEIILNTIKK